MNTHIIGTTSTDRTRLRDTFEEAEQDADYFVRCGYPCPLIFELSVVATYVKKIPWERVVSE